MHEGAVTPFGNYDKIADLYRRLGRLAVKHLHKGCRRSLLAIAAALPMIASPAVSADKPIMVATKANVVAVTHDWSGFYLGGHFGYSRGNFDPVFDANSLGSFGALHAGVEAGYNYMLSRHWLIGLEADVSFPNFLQTDDIVWTKPAMGNADVTEKLDYIGRVRGRVGYAFDGALIYGTAGYAWSQARFIESPGAISEVDKVLRTRSGWTAGIGAEVALSQGWSAKLEYLHDQLAATDAIFASGTRVESKINLHSLRLGMNWKVGSSNADTVALDRATSAARVLNDWKVHGQITLVGQGYPRSNSPYVGPKSLTGAAQFQNTGSATAFLGVRLWEGGEFYANPELMQGFGLSDVSGLAGFPNGEAQKSSFPVPRSNMARLFVRQTFGLGGGQETIEDGPNQLSGKQDINRITVTAGKFAVTDFFGGNGFANDPRTTFLNWNIYGNGSYDWTMDKLSWTWGAVTELNQAQWALRFGYFLVPDRSNSNYFDRHAPERGEYAAELELRYSLFAKAGKLRFFGWLNRANMGSYSEALALPITSPDYPDITLTRRVRTNYGIVVGVEQAITEDFGIFSRASWSPGLLEVIGWTDISNSFSFGGVLKGTSWGRQNDKIGIAGVTEGLSHDARSYFEAGGLGILIGDGRLNYRRENVLEAYYAYSFDKWTTLTFDYQLFINPAYNHDRGPVSVFSIRAHAEF